MLHCPRAKSSEGARATNLGPPLLMALAYSLAPFLLVVLEAGTDVRCWARLVRTVGALGNVVQQVVVRVRFVVGHAGDISMDPCVL
jgi:hypothetical protein